MSSNLFRFAYFGLPLGALVLARAGYVPRLIVLGHTDTPGARRVRRVLGRRTLVLGKPTLGEPDIVRTIASVRPEALLSWFYPKQIPASVLALAPRGAFGTHPSLLPRWRGPDPYFWALHAGDEATGVSLHRLEDEYDTGAVIAQRSLTIGPSDNAWRLAKRLDRPALQLLVDCAAALARGEALTGTAQDESLASLAPAPDESLLGVDWQRSVAEIVRLVRAAAPYPGASAEFGDEVVELLETARYDAPLPRALEPADAVWTPAGLVVKAADGGVLVTRARDVDGAILAGNALHDLFPAPLARVGFEQAGLRRR